MFRECISFGNLKSYFTVPIDKIATKDSKMKTKNLLIQTKRLLTLFRFQFLFGVKKRVRVDKEWFHVTTVKSEMQDCHMRAIPRVRGFGRDI